MEERTNDYLQTLRPNGGIIGFLGVDEEDELVCDAAIVENLTRELMVKEGEKPCFSIVVVDEKREFVSVDEIRDTVVIGDVVGEEDGHIVIDVMIGNESV